MTSDQLMDLYAIQSLKARYFRLIDTKAWSEWRSLFTDDLEYYIEHGPVPALAAPTMTGADTFVEFVSKALETSKTVHQGHTPEISLTGPDTATGIWGMFDWVDDATKGYALQGYGFYFEKYRKNSSGDWQVCELKLTRLRVDTVDPTPLSADVNVAGWKR